MKIIRENRSQIPNGKGRAGIALLGNSQVVKSTTAGDILMTPTRTAKKLTEPADHMADRLVGLTRSRLNNTSPPITRDTLKFSQKSRDGPCVASEGKLEQGLEYQSGRRGAVQRVSRNETRS